MFEFLTFLRNSKEDMVIVVGTENMKRMIEDIGLFNEYEIVVWEACPENTLYGMPKRVLAGKTILRDYIVKPSMLLDETCIYKALRAGYGNLDLLTGTVIKEGE